jgi:hypothetical protein
MSAVDTDLNYRSGLTHSGEEFLERHQVWLADADSVRVVRRDFRYHVVLRLDGEYLSYADAKRAAAGLQAEVRGLVEQFDLRRHRRADIGTYVLCPVCGGQSVLLRDLDRYLHTDGSNNRDCWAAIHRGEFDS